MIQIYFEPEKKWWEFWNRSRYLIEGDDFEVSHGRFILMKPLKGKFECTYKLQSK